MDQKSRFQLTVLFPLMFATIVTVTLWIVSRTNEAADSRTILYAASVLGIIALAMSGILYVISRSFSRRITVLESGVQRMKKGDFDTQMPVTGKDEVAEITRVFNDMTGELQEYLKLVNEHGKLQAELGEVQRIAESLRHTNIDLSDSLERLKRAQEQVLHKEHMDILLPMISGITHDFNEGLTSILAVTELAHNHPEKTGDVNEVKHWYETIEKVALEARDRVRSLAECYQPSSTQAEEVRIQEVLDRAIRVTRPKWGPEAEAQGLTFEIHTEYADTQPIYGIPNDLLKMVTHVIFNAIEAMPEGGHITVKTSDAGDGVALQIVDSGVGMDSKLQERCFKPFFSTKEDAAGIGLTVAKGIAQQHGGRIGIISEKGQGTTLVIELPARGQESIAAEAQQVVPRLERQLRILLVEDDAWTMDLLAENLRSEGHVVDTAKNGLEGMEKYRHGKYELVITDRAMPEMNGDELARVIKRIYPYEPVIMLTGFGEIMKGKGQVPPDVDAIVSKPVSMDRLSEAMAEALLKTGQAVGDPRGKRGG